MCRATCRPLSRPPRPVAPISTLSWRCCSRERPRLHAPQPHRPRPHGPRWLPQRRRGQLPLPWTGPRPRRTASTPCAKGIAGLGAGRRRDSPTGLNGAVAPAQNQSPAGAVRQRRRASRGGRAAGAVKIAGARGPFPPLPPGPFCYFLLPSQVSTPITSITTPTTSNIRPGIPPPHPPRSTRTRTAASVHS